MALATACQGRRPRRFRVPCNNYHGGSPVITRRLTLCSLIALGCMMAGASVAQAQATRTWVSGVGDDVNPCSRTAPCKTWAGAISKTAEGGEINALDPGGYGTLTITKSITINGRGTNASTLASGTSGFIVNADPTDVVIIRDVDIQGTRRGASPGTDGIRYLKARALHVYNVAIRGFNDSCIDVRGSATDTTPLTKPLRLFLGRSELADCNRGLTLAPVTARDVRASVTRSTIEHFDSTGVYADRAGTRATFRDVTITGGNFDTTGTAVFTEDSSRVNLESSLVEGSLFGLRAFSSSIIRASNTTITDNGTGLSPSGGQLLSRGNNTVQDNGVDGAFTGTFAPS